MNIFTIIVLSSIKFYQKFISPYKGFSCAHRKATNEMSCSAYGYKVIQRIGVLKGYALLNRRFFDCKWHAQNSLKESSPYLGTRLRQQAGFIDCDCGDMPDCGGGNDCGDCDGPDCGKNKSKHSEEFTKKRNQKNKQKFANKMTDPSEDNSK